MKKYKLLKPFSFLKKGNEIYVTVVKRTNLEQSKLKNFAKIYTKNKTYVGEMEILEQGEWFEEVIEKPKSVWDLKKGDIYYSLDMYSVSKYRWTGDIIDVNKRDSGFCFLSKEKAEKELIKIQAIQKIKRYCWKNGINIKYDNYIDNSYAFNLNYSGEVVFFDDYKNGNPIGYFSRDNAQKILDNFREELRIILE